MIPIQQYCRVIIDNDWAGDPDGLIGLAHHALSPANRIVAVTSSLTNPMFGPPEGMAKAGADLAADLLRVLDYPDRPTVHAGPDSPFTGETRETGAARAIVDAATGADGVRLFLVCAGPLTNVADALLLEPELAALITLVWVGGSARADNADEYNYFTDPAAAEFVLGNQRLDIWQFPSETYRRLVVSAAELDHALRKSGPAGTWLWDVFNGLKVPDFIKFGPLWCLGDSAPLIVTGLGDMTSSFEQTSESPDRRIYTDVDSRLVIADFFARLELHAARQAGN
ncbi:nucleoside hydrolase [Arthrobacter sp. BE255]|uniref:nucleoside hydrolase n=1 Tax=Arthrobacter sp. BE255 TaxID=2817721 RepID=UPI002860B17A|nr:nucleoside hydrolase [Arthrobacter sp. BE255]MDR7159696.1 inosine-uridine nucleoside N-ribohydrolase [Arthrobacter sp. BE255]